MVDSMTALDSAPVAERIGTAPPEWELLCDAARTARNNIDCGKYILGDLALEVDKAYGQDRIGQFAKDANVEVNRIKEYRSVAKFWRESMPWQTFVDEYPSLCYSHRRDAMRLGTPGAAFDFLNEASANSWTVEAARIELTKRLGKPVPHAPIVKDISIDLVGPQGDMFLIRVNDQDARRALYAGWYRETLPPLRMTLRAG